MKYTVIMCFLLSLLGCKSVEKNDTSGHTSGTVVYSNIEDDCAYTIKVTNTNADIFYLDPINLDELFKKDNMKIKFKYNTLKIMNRCDKATPISITDMIKLK